MIDFWNGIHTPDGVGSTGTVKQIIKVSNYEDSQALPFQGESVKDIATRAMAMLLTDVMKGD